MLFARTRMLVTPELHNELVENYGEDIEIKIGDTLVVRHIDLSFFHQPVRPVVVGLEDENSASYCASVWACECAAEIHRITMKAWGNGYTIAVPRCMWGIIRNMPRRDIRLLDFGWAYRKVPFGYELLSPEDCRE